MAQNKTQPTRMNAETFLAGAPHCDDARALAALMAQVSGERATMWGPSIVGFGTHHYRYESGREGDICRVGFAPRKAELVLYGMAINDANGEALDRLGKHRTGKGCLYIKRLADVDMGVLEEMVRNAWARNA